MSFRDDDRGASVQVGAIILFGFLVLAIAGWQATVVPQDNAEVEYNHNQRVQGEMEDLRNVVVSVPGRQTGQSVSITLGTQFPARTLFVNPAPPSGTLRTVGTDDPGVNVTITGATADGQTGDYWNGSGRSYETGGIAYAPNYHEFTAAPVTVYEHSVVYNEQKRVNEALTRSGQTLVQGDRITFVVVDGSFSTTHSDAQAVDVTPISSSDTVVTIQNETDGIELTVVSRLPAEKWEDLLADEMGADGNVENVTQTEVGDGLYEITIDLAGTDGDGDPIEYELRMAKVGVGSDASHTDATYVTDVGGTDVAVGEEAVAEVRDEYNNPVRGASVTIEVLAGSCPDAAGTRDTDENGQVSFTCEEAADVEVRIGSDAQERVTFQVGNVSDPPKIDSTSTSLTMRNMTKVGNDNTDLTQYAFETVVDDHSGAGLDYVFVELNDDQGEVVTGTTFELDGETTYDLEWMSPWIDAGNLTGDPSGYEVFIRVADNAGNVEKGTIQVGGSLQQPAFFEVTNFDAPGTARQGETITITADVTNTGDESANQTIEYRFDGAVEKSTTETLAPGASSTVTFEYTIPSDQAAGDYLHRVRSEDDDDGATIQVIESGPYFQVTNFTAPDNAQPGETITASADLENVGDESANQTIEYRFDGAVEKSTTETLAPGASSTVTFEYTIPANQSSGTYSHEIASENESDGATIDVSANDPPTASFTSSCTGLDCSFDASNSTDPDGTVEYYIWDFDGDGTTDLNTTQATVNYTYGTAGTYDVELTVQDDDGATNSTGEQVSTGGGITVENVRSATGSANSLSQVLFDINSSRTDAVDIEAVETDATAADIDQINGDDDHSTKGGGANPELRVDVDGDGAYDDSVNVMGPSALPANFDLTADGSTETLGSGATGEGSIYEFEKSNNGNPVDMNNEKVTITVYFRTPDGTLYSTTVTVTVA